MENFFKTPFELQHIFLIMILDISNGYCLHFQFYIRRRKKMGCDWCMFDQSTYPALRNVLANGIPKWHQVLCQPPTEIDKQVYGRHKIQLNPSTLDLNYKNINNNHVTRSPRSFDYTVQDPLSLAKLFVQPFMSKFTGFDQTMDISAVLSVIGEAAPFIGAAAHAKTVRSDIRNEWAHCNFTNWTEVKFIAAF